MPSDGAPADDTMPADEPRRQLRAGDEQAQHHCGREEPTCNAASGQPSSKQRNQIPILAHLTAAPEPDLAAMNYGDAKEWVAKRWTQWMLKSDDDVIDLSFRSSLCTMMVAVAVDATDPER